MDDFDKQIQNFKGYLGNQSLKRAGVRIAWTPALLIEHAKCSQDPIYFAENYMKVITAGGKLRQIELYEYQKDIIRSLHKNPFTIVLTARQAGKTTAVTAFILWYVLFQPEDEPKNVALLANKAEVAQETLKRIQTAYECLPKWLQQGVVEWNKRSVEFENRCRIFAGATSKDTFRGFTIQMLFIDEVAMVENWDEFYTSTFNTMSGDTTGETKIAMVSTPNGLNHFHDFWVGATAPGDRWNGWNPIKVTWESVPGRDEKWKLKALRGVNFDYIKFSQEHEGEFLGSSGTLISGGKLKQLQERLLHLTPLVYQNNLAQYEKPQKGRRYMMTCDVSRGKGLDYSAFHVIDVTELPWKQVCTFRDNLITPLDYAAVIFRTGKSYNDAPVLVEINDIGEQVSTALFHDFEYENIIMTENNGRLGKRVAMYGGKEKDYGVRTTKNVKAIGCSMLKLLIEQDKLLIQDKFTYDELTTFSRKNDSVTFEAEQGKHDDLVMGLVLFAWMSDQQYFKELTDINTLQMLREKTEDQMMEEMLPFGFLQDGADDVETEEIKEVSMSEFDRWLTS